MPTLKDAIYGLAIGDALGVPYEFMPRGSFKACGMDGYGTHNMPAGTFSDDTSLTLATCDSIKQCKQINIDHMRNCFKDWYMHGKYAVDGEVFDVGNTTAQAIIKGHGLNSEYSNGNGSLMRIIPLAFIDNITNDEIEAVSAITHAHEVSKSICVLYVRFAIDLISGSSIRDAMKKLPKEYQVASLPLEEIGSSGYVVDTFKASLWALANTNTFKDCVLEAVNMGDDTDTTAAVAGALAGIVYGFKAIPKEWINALRGKDIIELCLF
jgi:ADP-ribosyl-[dinitrogen reductase] hydrolase